MHVRTYSTSTVTTSICRCSGGANEHAPLPLHSVMVDVKKDASPLVDCAAPGTSHSVLDLHTAASRSQGNMSARGTRPPRSLGSSNSCLAP